MVVGTLSGLDPFHLTESAYVPFRLNTINNIIAQNQDDTVALITERFDHREE